MKNLGFIVLWVCLSIPVAAQNEVFRESSSLQGIEEFGIVVNIEKPSDLEHDELSAPVIRNSIADKLKDLDVRLIDDEELRNSDKYPILYVHVNIMQAAKQLYPYSIELNFYQPVKLILQYDLQTTATTWNSGLVGLVSGDLIHQISEEAVYASTLFKDAFERVN